MFKILKVPTAFSVYPVNYLYSEFAELFELSFNTYKVLYPISVAFAVFSADGLIEEPLLQK